MIPFQADKVNFKILFREAVKERWVKRLWGLSLQRLEKFPAMVGVGLFGFFGGFFGFVYLFSKKPQQTKKPLGGTSFDYSQT